LSDSTLAVRAWARRKLVHAAVTPDEKSGAILTPIFQSTTYVQVRERSVREKA
jgi:O-acetylhomoserine/O-acetylserine sulfhydrylase-like pyridoxal-dependent enzyme